MKEKNCDNYYSFYKTPDSFKTIKINTVRHSLEFVKEPYYKPQD